MSGPKLKIAWDAPPDARSGASPPPLRITPEGPEPNKVRPPDGAVTDLPESFKFAPAEAPELPAVGVPETAVTEYAQGTTLNTADEISAARQANDNARMARPDAPPEAFDPRRPRGRSLLAQVPHPVAAGPGIDAPLKGSDAYYRQEIMRRAAGQQQNPGTALAANLTGAVASGVAVPAVRAVEGAGLLARGAAGLANVGVDTVLGSAAAAGNALEGQRGEAAASAAPVSAGVSAGLRGGLGMLRAGFGAGRRALSTLLPEQEAKAARELTEMGPKGREVRAAALRGQAEVDPATRAITKAVSEAEEHIDAVTNYAKVGLKRQPIVKHMARDGVNPQLAVMRVGGTVERLAMELDELAAKPAGAMEVSGRQAVDYARDAFANTRDELIDALGRTGEEGGDAAADVFMRADHLKRQLGRAYKRAMAGANPDTGTAESLETAYHTMRELLEDQAIWGKGAAGVQREVNAAWTPWLTQRPGYKETVLAGKPRKRGASGFDELLEADPSKVQSLLENAGRASNDLRERDLSHGLETSAQLVDQLSKHYEAPPQIASRAQAVGQNARDVAERFGQTREDLVRARELADVRTASPMLGKAINVGANVEHLAGQVPGASAVRAAMERGGKPSARTAAIGAGAANAAATNSRRSDAAQDDPRWGRLLSSQPAGDKRDATYMTLLHQDPEFRAREQARGEQQEETEQ